MSLETVTFESDIGLFSIRTLWNNRVELRWDGRRLGTFGTVREAADEVRRITVKE